MTRISAFLSSPIATLLLFTLSGVLRLLKGNGFWDVMTHVWPIAVFMLVVMSIGVKRYRRTLD